MDHFSFSPQIEHCRADIFRLLVEAQSFFFDGSGDLFVFDEVELLVKVKALMHCGAFRIDSREVKRGDIFIAVPGKKVDGSLFVPDVMDRAGFVFFSSTDWHERRLKKWFLSLCDVEKEKIKEKCIVVDKNKIVDFSTAFPAPFYGYPAEKMHLTGLTGTNGKTSLCYILERLYEKNFSIGVIGTIGARFFVAERGLKNHEKILKKKHFALNKTTPNAAVLQHLLAKMVDAGVQMVFMEISSHSLILGRTKGLRLDSFLWTNFSTDHLDFHRTIGEYFQAKCLGFGLLKQNKKSFALVGTRGLKGFDFCKKIKGLSFPVFGLHHFSSTKDKDVYGLSDDFSGHFFYEEQKKAELDQGFSEKTHFLLSCGDWEKEGQSSLALDADFFGGGAAENLSMALLHRHIYREFLSLKNPADFTFSADGEWQKDLNLLRGLEVPGRMARVDDFPVYVDYAHTPDALAKALGVLRGYQKKLVVVFGCGGNRDKKKRGLMGQCAFDFADIIIVTSDNPRTEDPLDIISEIIRPIVVSDTGNKNISNHHKSNVEKKLIIIPSREKAIAFVNTLLKGSQDKNQWVLLAGKGHESTQEDLQGMRDFDEPKIIRSTFSDFLKNRFFLSEMVDLFGIVKLFVAGQFYDANLFSIGHLSIVKKWWNTDGYRLFFTQFTGVFTDTRAEKKGEIFFAFDGDKYEAIDFLEDALKAKIKVLIVNKKHFDKLKIWSKENSKIAIVFVEDVFLAYRQLATYKMRRIAECSKKPYCHIAITGSAGKTGVKAVLGHVLSQKYNVFTSLKNYNNHVGVPYNVFCVDRFYDVYIFEMGMSKAGDIAQLASIIRPNVVLLTNIFAAHAQNFSSIRDIALGKAEFFSFGAFDHFLMDDKKKKSFTKHPRVFLLSDIHFRELFCRLAKKNSWDAELVSQGFFSNVSLKVSEKSLTTNVLLEDQNIEKLCIKGLFPYADKMFALVYALAFFLGLKKETILKYFLSLPENIVGRRFEVIRKNPLLIDDSYNANPSSVIFSIDFLVQTLVSKKEKESFILFLEICVNWVKSQIITTK